MNTNLTLVTALYDIGRGDLEGFGRSFDHYIECFERLLKVELPLVVFCDDDVEEIVWKHRSHDNTRVVKRPIETLYEFPFFDITNTIRQKEEWRGQAGWIPDSPQSQLELYNPLVMSKQFMLNDAAIFNFFNTKYFLWIDAGIANTIGDPAANIHEEFARKVVKRMHKMMYICFPYDGKVEVHGFPKKEFNDLAHQETTRVARGGMFGGSRTAIADMNDMYYQLLKGTLESGYMGTEESIFTLLTYRHPEMCHIEWIQDNGLIITALNNINSDEDESNDERLAIYALTFNLPEQFKMWVESFKNALPGEFADCKKYVINNSTDPSVNEEYQQIFAEHDFTEFKFDNIGICGGRQFAAEHFNKSGHKYMVFFEDDMLLNDSVRTCKSGFTTFFQRVFDKCIDILEIEELDYLKLSFSEFFGDNHENWAFYNVPQEKKDLHFPEHEDGRKRNPTIINHTATYRGIPYAVGEYHYCNWPILFGKSGNKKVFLETEWTYKYEQTWMSYVMDKIRDGYIKPGCLLASIITHHRKYHYEGDTRKENEH
jgi:hypothetical protein